MLNKTSISFGAHRVDLSQAGTINLLPSSAQPSIGGLSMYAYKRAVVRWTIDGPGAFEGTVRVTANNETLPQATTGISTMIGVDKIGGQIEVDLASLQGQTRLDLEVEVTTGGGATAQIWAAMDIEYANAAGC